MQSTPSRQARQSCLQGRREAAPPVQSGDTRRPAYADEVRCSVPAPTLIVDLETIPQLTSPLLSLVCRSTLNVLARCSGRRTQRPRLH